MLASLFMPSAVHSAGLLLIQDEAGAGSDQNNQDANRQGETTGQDDASNVQSTEPPAPPQTRRILEVSGGRIKLDVKQWPMAGSTDAEFVCVEMFDYNCQHCRETHAAVKAAKQKLGDRFAVITLPLPLNTACNSQISQTGAQFAESCLQANLAVAVWKVNPEKFAEFHDWMFEGARAPSYKDAKAHAEKMVGKEELEKMLNSTLPKAYIEKHVQIYGRLNRGNIPKLLFRTTSIVGLFQSPDQLIEILNRQGPLTETPVAN
jgi:protein-disulfide isomerase